MQTQEVGGQGAGTADERAKRWRSRLEGRARARQVRGLGAGAAGVREGAVTAGGRAGRRRSR